MKILQIIFFILISNVLFGQSTDIEMLNNRINQLSDSLTAEKKIVKYVDGGQELSFGVVDDSIVTLRKSAFEKLEQILNIYINNPITFYTFPEEANAIKVIYPKDSTFRIITWIAQFSNNEYQYGGAIQFKENRKPIILEPTLEEEDFELATFDANNWLPALYYNIHEFKKDGESYYLLFGYDGYRQYSHRKWIDVLYFDDKGNPKFGENVFVFENEQKSKIKRLVLEYAAEINIKLNFNDEENLVMYDHLIPMKSRYVNEEVFVPDGSYEGFKLKRGKWNHIDKIKTLIMDEAPRDHPVLDARKNRNIIGQ